MTDPAYPVSEIYPCIQGEGIQAGRPMTLVRLHGCSVHCYFCDTPYTWQDGEEVDVPLLLPDSRYTRLTPGQILSFLADPSKVPWVLLTGGEPAEHDLSALLLGLEAEGYLVALETSGTAWGDWRGPIEWITVSPKPGNPGGRPLIPDAIARANEIRWLVGKHQDLLDLQQFMIDYNLSVVSTDICIQPISMGQKATNLCVAACHEFGYRLSVQTQKYLQLR